jgi:putative phosphoribosyl transferase
VARESLAHASETRPVRIASGEVLIDGDLSLPPAARGVVVFAHGSGSSRHSPRNRYMAEALQDAELGTLLLDLLTPDEELIDLKTGHLRFDIELLADRLVHAADWLRSEPDTRSLPFGYFGASTGAAAALMAAAKAPDGVSAIVSRGGRPDLAGPALARVRAPTLLIVGGYDAPVIEMNRVALTQLTVETRLDIVPRAGHLFEEPGALDQVSRMASEWFRRYLGRHVARAA